jgi:hypothetical protein
VGWYGADPGSVRDATPDEIEHHPNAIRDAEAAPGNLLLPKVVA